MKKLLIIIVSVAIVGLVLLLALQRGAPTGGTPQAATSTPPAQPSADFRGPTGPPQIIGPSGPPPTY